MSISFMPRWPEAWTEAGWLLALAVVALAGVRAAGWFPFPAAGGTREYARPRVLAGLALVAPAVVVPLLAGRALSDLGLALGWLAPPLLALPLGALLFGAAFTGARRRRHKEAGAGSAGPALVVVVGAWAAYLLGYELLFRGALLFTLVDVVGGWPAIALTTAIYALAHLDKGAGETLASLPFGVVLAVLTIESGSILAAFLLHLALAAGHEAGAREPRTEAASLRS